MYRRLPGSWDKAEYMYAARKPGESCSVSGEAFNEADSTKTYSLSSSRSFNYKITS